MIGVANGLQGMKALRTWLFEYRPFPKANGWRATTTNFDRILGWMFILVSVIIWKVK